MNLHRNKYLLQTEIFGAIPPWKLPKTLTLGNTNMVHCKGLERILALPCRHISMKYDDMVIKYGHLKICQLDIHEYLPWL